jgi:hypothetical protein
MRRIVKDGIMRYNSPKQRMPPEIRVALTETFAPDVRELARIIGRDLSRWLK